ncbi:MAG: ATP-dependent zinc metalloprotease FtsH [Gemmatales bacterium]|nr:ATP-dependent zinc metalloprotease FtsH [Gemmatales bacterium]
MMSANHSPQSEQQSQRPNRRPSGLPTIPWGAWWIAIIAAILLALFLGDQFSGSNHVPYGQFKEFLRRGYIAEVRIGSNKITGRLKETVEVKDEQGQTVKKEIREVLPEPFQRWKDLRFSTRVPSIVPDNQLTQQLEQMQVDWDYEKESGGWIWPVLVYWLPTLLLLGFLFFLFVVRLRDPLGGGFLSSYIKSPARRFDKGKVRVTFNDVADMEHAKAELQEVVEFLRNPEKFQRLGGQIPKGILLVGPPGTGKTLLARAVAGEAGVPFFSINGSEFIQMFVGVGASRVRDLFKTARENAPCILFIDEIDAVGRVRGAGLGGGHDEREQTLNQILSEMDGFLPTESVIVIAATNRPDVLDPALLRPGRFDRHVTIDRPNWRGRLEILKVHTRDKPLAPDVNLEQIARTLIGATGADLRNLVNEAALFATREGKNKIDRRDFERALDKVLIGAKREEVLSPEDKRKTAYHEAGHALIAWLMPHADKPLKVSIVPRGQALGVNINIPEEERFHHDKAYFETKLTILMGGRAADRLVYGQPFAGAEMDLKQATRIARLMVTHWGMSERLGPVAYRVGEEHVFLGKEIHEPRDFSEGTAQLIDEEVRRLLREADERAYELLSNHRDKLDRIVEALLQKEELTRDELEELLRDTPYSSWQAPTSDGQLTSASDSSPIIPSIA